MDSAWWWRGWARLTWSIPVISAASASGWAAGAAPTSGRSNSATHAGWPSVASVRKTSVSSGARKAGKRCSSSWARRATSRKPSSRHRRAVACAEGTCTAREARLASSRAQWSSLSTTRAAPCSHSRTGLVRCRPRGRKPSCASRACSPSVRCPRTSAHWIPVGAWACGSRVSAASAGSRSSSPRCARSAATRSCSHTRLRWASWAVR
ncbi:Uncharacterised protein [Mycobacteroides abscessus subsp. abscessus]|nr:Uncharacterised protein [Mycobacteroides abscessus subsp. abscessus]